MFSGLGYTTRQMCRLSDVWISCELKVACVDRKLIRAIFNSSQIHSSSSLRSSLVFLPDPENMGIAVGNLFLLLRLRL